MFFSMCCLIVRLHVEARWLQLLQPQGSGSTWQGWAKSLFSSGFNLTCLNYLLTFETIVRQEEYDSLIGLDHALFPLRQRWSPRHFTDCRGVDAQTVKDTLAGKMGIEVKRLLNYGFMPHT